MSGFIMKGAGDTTPFALFPLVEPEPKSRVGVARRAAGRLELVRAIAHPLLERLIQIVKSVLHAAPFGHVLSDLQDLRRFAFAVGQRSRGAVDEHPRAVLAHMPPLIRRVA